MVRSSKRGWGGGGREGVDWGRGCWGCCMVDDGVIQGDLRNNGGSISRHGARLLFFFCFGEQCNCQITFDRIVFE